MDEDFDAEIGFDDEDMEVEEHMEDDEGFEDDEGGKPSKKVIIIAIASIVLTIFTVLVALSFLSGGGKATEEGAVNQEEVQRLIDEAYTKGVNDTKGEYESQLADKNQEISELSSQMRKKSDEANNMNNRAHEANENQKRTLEEAQDAIDEIARDRDMWRERAEEAERGQ